MYNIYKEDKIMDKDLIRQSEIASKIYIIRGKKVMFDSDLALFYSVLTKNLNKAVVRNIDRFPLDFMFQLTKKEFDDLKFHFGTSSWGGKRKLPRFNIHKYPFIYSLGNWYFYIFAWY